MERVITGKFLTGIFTTGIFSTDRVFRIMNAPRMITCSYKIMSYSALFSFQIGAVKFDISSGLTVGTFDQYIVPQKTIDNSASEVNGLYLVNKKLCSRSKEDLTLREVPASPVRIVLTQFIELAFGSNVNHQVLLLGFNNSAFDDHVLLNNCKHYLDDSLYTRMRRKMFSVDSRSLLNCPRDKKLKDILVECGGDSRNLHDALKDCEALVTILRAKSFTLESALQKARSFESVLSKRTNPLIKAKLITDAVARYMPAPMSCHDWLAMTEVELEEYLKNLGAKRPTIVTCIAKRRLKGVGSEGMKLG